MRAGHALVDTNGDGVAEIVTGGGFGRGPRIRSFDPARGLAVVLNLFAYSPLFWGGVLVATGRFTPDYCCLQNVVTVWHFKVRAEHSHIARCCAVWGSLFQAHP